VVAILLGLVIERGVLRPLIGEPIIAVIMVTFASPASCGACST